MRAGCDAFDDCTLPLKMVAKAFPSRDEEVLLFAQPSMASHLTVVNGSKEKLSEFRSTLS